MARASVVWARPRSALGVCDRRHAVLYEQGTENQRHVSVANEVACNRAPNNGHVDLSTSDGVDGRAHRTRSRLVTVEDNCGPCPRCRGARVLPAAGVGRVRHLRCETDTQLAQAIVIHGDNSHPLRLAVTNVYTSMACSSSASRAARRFSNPSP